MSWTAYLKLTSTITWLQITRPSYIRFLVLKLERNRVTKLSSRVIMFMHRHYPIRTCISWIQYSDWSCLEIEYIIRTYQVSFFDFAGVCVSDLLLWLFLRVDNVVFDDLFCCHNFDISRYFKSKDIKRIHLTSFF